MKGTGSTLTIDSIKREDAGVYQCTAFNYVSGSAKQDILITVKYPPTDLAIIELPGRKLQCIARGGAHPAPYYTWSFSNGKHQGSS